MWSRSSESLFEPEKELLQKITQGKNTLKYTQKTGEEKMWSFYKVTEEKDFLMISEHVEIGRRLAGKGFDGPVDTGHHYDLEINEFIFSNI